jgi:hypothetical protein
MTAPKDATIAARIKLSQKYTLLGFFENAGERYALVRLHDCDPSYFATFQVVDDAGTCILGHYFGEKQYNDALDDFLIRARISALHVSAGRLAGRKKR